MLPVVPKSVHSFKSKYLPNGPFEYAPFTVGQESILLAVKDSEKASEKNNAVRQIVRECIVTPGYDVDSIPLFLLELVFLRLREKALGEYMEFTYICKHETKAATDGEDAQPAEHCNEAIDVKIDLRQIDVKEYEGHASTIMVTDTIGIKMRYPNFGLLDDSEKDDAALMVSCIELIFDGDNITHAKDVPPETLRTWYKGLEMSVKVRMFKTFMSTMPHIYHKHEVTCPKCGTHHKIEFAELGDFFT